MMDWMKEQFVKSWEKTLEENWEMGWQEDGSFRVCPNCGATFHIQSGDGQFNYCPTCGIKQKGS